MSVCNNVLLEALTDLCHFCGEKQNAEGDTDWVNVILKHFIYNKSQFTSDTLF